MALYGIGENGARNRAGRALPFERKLMDLRQAWESAPVEADRTALAEAFAAEWEAVRGQLTPWDRVQLARHPLRPRMMDYIPRVFEDLIELHGDRALGDDPAVVGAIGRFRGRTVVIVGQQKGVSTEEKVERRFGMAHPEGYRKALRIFALAERFHLPEITLVDTPAAHPGVEAEQRGQGPAIAQSLLSSLQLNTPMLSVILSEGGSGGALALAVADRVVMFEFAIYAICPPERCAEILWRDMDRKDMAAAALRMTAADQLALGIVDAVLPEPIGGAHFDPDRAAQTLAAEIDGFLRWSDAGHWSLEKRQARFARMGVWLEEGGTGGSN